MPKDTSLNVP